MRHWDEPTLERERSMIPDSAEKWIIAFVFGTVMVGMYSWSRFDEPSYDSQSEYFSRYKPGSQRRTHDMPGPSGHM
jgi:hypothetical protein